MPPCLPTRRKMLRGFVATGAGLALFRPHIARAAPRLRLVLNWLAEAENGGFYQAQATGLYEKAGLDVQISQGGPQVNNIQLLVGGAADIALGYDMQVLNGIERGLPLRVIAATFQVDLQGLMARPDITSLAALKGHKIFIAGAGYSTYWPWLKQKFGYTDDMAGPKGASLQTFFADPNSAVAGYITSEPYIAQQRGQAVNFLLFSQQGWPTYTNPVITTPAVLAAQGALIRPFLRASMEGWKSYMADPAPGNALIMQANPKMDPGQLAFSLNKLRDLHALQTGDAATQGIGIITEERWGRTHDFMAAIGLLKPDTAWREAVVTDYIRGLDIKMP